MKKILFLLALLITATIVCNAQDGEWKKYSNTTYTNADGTKTEGIVQAAYGAHAYEGNDVFYVGFKDGTLASCYGQDEETIKHCVTLPKGILCISAGDYQSSLNVLCSNGNLYEVNVKDFTYELITSGPGVTFKKVAINDSGKYYAATATGGVYSMDKDAKEWTKRGDVDGNVTALGVNGDSTVLVVVYRSYLSTDGGVSLTSAGAGDDKWAEVGSVDGNITALGASGNTVLGTAESNDDNYYHIVVGNDGHVSFVINLDEDLDGWVEAIIGDPIKSGCYYLPVSGYGIELVDLNNNTVTPYYEENEGDGSLIAASSPFQEENWATDLTKFLAAALNAHLNSESQKKSQKASLKSAMLLEEEEAMITTIFVGDKGLYLFAKSDGTLSEAKQIPGCNEYFTGVGSNYVLTIDTIDQTTLKMSAALVAYAWGETSLWCYSEVVDSAYYNLAVSEGTIEIPWTGTNTITFNIASNDNWAIASTQSWLTTEPDSGSGDATITLVAGANPAFDARTGTLTITGDEGLVQTVVITQAGAEPYISVSVGSLTISGTGGSGNGATFDVGSNVSWGVLSNQSWLTVSPTSGTGNGTVTVTADVNPTVADRTATITVSADGVASQTVTVTQAAGATTLSVSPSTLNVAAIASSTATFTISSNSNWSVLSDQAWLTVGSASGTGNSPVTVTAEENPTITERTAIVTVSANEVTSKTVTITQAAGAATLSVSPTTLNIAAAEGSNSSFTITSNIGWVVLSNQTWIIVSKAFGTGNSDLFVIAEANPTLAERTAILMVSSTGVGTYTVTITQAAGAAILSVTPANLEIGSVEGSTASFDIASNMSWTITSDQSWLTASLLSGLENGNITLTAEENQMVTERVANVTVSANGVASQTVTVTQAAGAATLSVSTYNLDIGASEGSTASFDVVSNTTWTVSSDQTWLALSPTTGDGNGAIALTAEGNSTNSERTAIVTVAASGVDSQNIGVTQAARVGVLNADLGEVSVYPNPFSDGFYINAGEDVATVSVFDIRGRKVLAREISGIEFILAGQLSEGFYMVELATDQSVLMKKLIKE